MQKSYAKNIAHAEWRMWREDHVEDGESHAEFRV
jgi:hypothetical protein